MESSVTGVASTGDPAEETTVSTRRISLAVVGSGFSGLAAAIEAAEHLLPDEESRIVIVEKMKTPGGNSALNGGQIAAACSNAQKIAGIKDSVKLMLHDMLLAGADLNHQALIQRLVEESSDTVRWTEEELGVQYRQ
jgi:succinate dehydrogenase/fumarate reductase flavoprotein subunit